MDIYQLQYFMEIYEQKSFSKAAKELYISQQGISKAIAKLESELGVSLFYRSASGLQPTAYAENLKEHAQLILNSHKAILQEVEVLKEHKKTTLTVSYSEGILHMLPKDFLSTFMRMYPDIHIVLKKKSDLECEESLLQGEADMGLCTAPFDSGQFVPLLIIDAKIFAMVNEEHSLSRKKILSMEDLQGEKLISLGPETKHYLPFTTTLKEYGLVPQIFINPSDTNIQFDLCKSNIAIGFYSGNREHIAGNVAMVPLKEARLYTHLVLLALKEAPITEAMKIFTESVRQACEALKH